MSDTIRTYQVKAFNLQTGRTIKILGTINTTTYAHALEMYPDQEREMDEAGIEYDLVATVIA